MAAWSVDWTREQLTDDHKRWLLGLPPVFFQDDWMAVHGAPVDKHYFYAYVYHLTYQSNLDWLQERHLHFAFHGHSHIQACYARSGGEDRLINDNSLPLQEYLRALVCPGSVGQPRGGSVEAEYAVFDGATHELQFRRIPYNVDITVQLMSTLQFPVALYERLRQGK